jgi:hypothetical protein
MERLIVQLGSRWAAAQELARTGKISGKATEASKTKRMMKVYDAMNGNSLTLSDTF